MERQVGIFSRCETLPRAIHGIVLHWALTTALLASFEAKAQSYPGLADGLEILSLYRNVDPIAKERLMQRAPAELRTWLEFDGPRAAFDRLMQRVPADVRARVEASTFGAEQSNMTPKQLEDAVYDDSMRVVPTGDGLAVIPAEKLNDGIKGLTEFIIDQPETSALIDRHKDRFPALLQTLIQGLLKEAKRGPGGARTAIQSMVSQAVNSKIDKEWQSIRQQVQDQGAEAVLREARSRASARIAPGDTGSQQQQQQQQPQPQAPQQGGADLAGSISEAVNRLDAFEREVVAPLEVESARCRQEAAAVPDLSIPEDAIADTIARQSFPDHLTQAAIQQAENMTRLASALSQIIDSVKQAADRLCGLPASQMPANSVELLNSRVAVARGTYEGIKAQLDTALGELATSVSQQGLVGLRAILQARQNFCAANQNKADQVRQRLLQVVRSIFGDAHLDVWGRLGRIEDSARQAEATSGPFDVDMMSLKLRIAKTRSRVQGLNLNLCHEAAKSVDDRCKAIASSPHAAEIERRISEAAALERRRQDIRQRTADLLARITRDIGAAEDAATRGRACIAPPPPVQTGCNQIDIENAFGAAQTDYHAERHDAAKAKLKDIRSIYGQCPGIPERVDRAEDLLQKETSNNTRVSDAIARCDIQLMERYIAEIAAVTKARPVHQRWANSMRAAIPDCKNRRVADANDACRHKHGVRAFALSIGPDATPQCGCSTGNAIASGTCDDPPSVQPVAAPSVPATTPQPSAAVPNTPRVTPPSNTRREQAPVRLPSSRAAVPPSPKCGAGCRLQGARLVNGQSIGGYCVCPRNTFRPRVSPPVARGGGACNPGFVRNRNGLCVPNLGNTLQRLQGVLR